MERNRKRERKVPEEVIKRMYLNFYIPQYYEGFDDIQIRYNSDYMFDFDTLEDMSQDNPYHTLTVLEHCQKVYSILHDRDCKITGLKLRTAGLLHDIGKIETKTFKNCKGEITEIAHYYSHEKVSAYNSLFYTIVKMIVTGDSKDSINEALEILSLIQWHMLLHFNLSEKTITKYKNMLGEDTWRDLEILHKADCEAR